MDLQGAEWEGCIFWGSWTLRTPSFGSETHLKLSRGEVLGLTPALSMYSPQHLVGISKINKNRGRTKIKKKKKERRKDKPSNPGHASQIIFTQEKPRSP